MLCNKKKITKLWWHNASVFIAHMSGVSWVSSQGAVFGWVCFAVPTGCPLTYIILNRAGRALLVCCVYPSHSRKLPQASSHGDDRDIGRTGSPESDSEPLHWYFHFILLAKAKYMVKSRERQAEDSSKLYGKRGGYKEGEESGSCLQSMYPASSSNPSTRPVNPTLEIFPMSVQLSLSYSYCYFRSL